MMKNVLSWFVKIGGNGWKECLRYLSWKLSLWKQKIAKNGCQKISNKILYSYIILREYFIMHLLDWRKIFYFAETIPDSSELGKCLISLSVSKH